MAGSFFIVTPAFLLDFQYLDVKPIAAAEFGGVQRTSYSFPASFVAST
jgi:hypothetical protein